MNATSELGFGLIFDVGANIGAWTKEASKCFSNGEFHCFELSAETYKTLQENIRLPNVKLNNVGMSDKIGDIEYKDYGKNSTVNTLLIKTIFHDKCHSPTFKQGKVVTGSDYCAANNIHFIDFLKIDVEGAEGSVLKAFSTLLSRANIRLIQFEYGYANGDAHYLMRDFYEFFQQFDYIVGQLRPNRVDFSEWSYKLNDFDSGPNYVAIHKTDTELLTILSTK